MPEESKRGCVCLMKKNKNDGAEKSRRRSAKSKVEALLLLLLLLRADWARREGEVSANGYELTCYFSEY